MKKQKINKKSRIIIGIIILLLITFTIFAIYIPHTEAIEITQLKNNGYSQMMGYIIKTKNDKIVVIDGGTSEDSENFIKHIGTDTNKIDAWFITHPHKDHASVIIDVINNTQIPIDNIYVTLNDLQWYKENEPQRYEEVERFFDTIQNENVKDKIHEVELHQKIQIDNINCEILGVKNPEITNKAINNSSMVIGMEVNNKSILFLGDTSEESQEKLIENNPVEKLKADIVQMAHHGQGGVNEEFYKLVNPKICMWPTPEWLWKNDSGEGENSGPWLTKTTRKWIENLNVDKNIIEKDGDITIKVW